MKLSVGLLSLIILLAIFDSRANEKNLINQSTLDSSGFNGAILVTQNNKLIVEKYNGYADAEKQTQLTQQHLFSPGSLSKEFTTMAIMMLHEKGLLTYQDKIANYLTELPDWAGEVTIEQVMTHTSGFAKITWKKNISTNDAKMQIKNSKFSFTPGTDYLYSNLNVVVRALIVEKVTGKPFSEFLQDKIFTPLNMHQSYLQTSQSDISLSKVNGDYPTFVNGVTIYLAPSDLLKFEQGLTQNKLLPLPVIQSKLNGKNLSGSSNRALYDFGSYHQQEGQLITWQHDGSNPSHHTLKFHDFKRDIIILIMSSDGNKSTLFKLKDQILDNFIAD